MVASIGDWFDNRAGRRDGGPGHDPENDDPVDRGRDAWLDDLHTPPAPAHRDPPRAAGTTAPAPGRRRVTRSGPSAADRLDAERRTAAVPTSKPAMSMSAMARRVRALDASATGWTVSALTRKIREYGWPQATKSDIRKALSGTADPAEPTGGRAAPPPPPKKNTPRSAAPRIPARRRSKDEREARVWAIITGVRGIRPDPLRLHVAMMVFDQVASLTDTARLHRLLHRCGWTGLDRSHTRRLAAVFAAEAAATRPAVLAAVDCHHATLTAAIRAMRAAAPDLPGPAIAVRLRELGWSRMTTARVQEILARMRTPAPNPVARTAPAPTPAPAPPPHTLDIRERPNRSTCHGCGRVISRLGVCGCA